MKPYLKRISPYFKFRTIRAIFDRVFFDRITFDGKKDERIDPYGGIVNPYGKKTTPYGKKTNPYGKRTFP